MNTNIKYFRIAISSKVRPFWRFSQKKVTRLHLSFRLMCGSWGFWLAEKSFIGVFSETPVLSVNIRVTCTPDNLVSTSNAWGAPPPGGAPPMCKGLPNSRSATREIIIVKQCFQAVIITYLVHVVIISRWDNRFN